MTAPSLRTVLRDAARRLDDNPTVLAFGAIHWTILLASIVVAVVATRESAPLLVVAIGLYVLGLPLSVGIYRTLTDDSDAYSGSLSAGFDAITTNARSVLLAKLVAVLAVLGTALATTGVWYVLDTGVRLARYAQGSTTLPNTYMPVYLLVFAGLLGTALGRFPVLFTDLAALDGQSRRRSAWRASLALLGQRKRSALGLLALDTALYGLLFGIGVAPAMLIERGALRYALPVLVLWFVGSLLATYLACVRAVFFNNVSATVPTPSQSLISRRTVLAGVVFLAAVGGAGYLRTTEMGAAVSSHQSLPEESVAAYDVAVDNTATVNHRQITTVWNETNESDTYTPLRRVGYDYRDRQYRHRLTEDDTELRGFIGEAVFASSTLSGIRKTPFSKPAGEWGVIRAPGFYVALDLPGEAKYRFPDVSRNWTVVADNESTIVFRTEDSDEVWRSQSGVAYASRDIESGSYARMVVDRSRGVVEGGTFRVVNPDENVTRRIRLSVEDIGTADVRRPAVFGPPHPVEWLWDAIYY